MLKISAWCYHCKGHWLGPSLQRGGGTAFTGTAAQPAISFKCCMPGCLRHVHILIYRWDEGHAYLE
ncbi:hypothetical protein PVAP13_3KG262885 [Panicum virgatum]|uniref:Uncharacterized protein n=1 Tax=Panicum virgatum TaxID=38727 RepID=A0A8T0V6T9_PANVG|nr:hypothetical protein PVAP13_3KG262885 [Panicum virgatum]